MKTLRNLLPLMTVCCILLPSEAVCGNDGEANLFGAIESSSCTEIQNYLKDGADVSVRDEIGATPLMRALEKNLPSECVRTLLSAGADPNATHGPLKISVLMVGASYSTAETVSILLEAGAKADFSTPDGWTALMSATRNSSRPNVIRELVAQGADVNALDQHGATPLMRAVQDNPQFEIVETLVRLGADLRVETPEGYTAHELAKSLGRDRALLELLDPWPRQETNSTSQ